MNYLDTKQSLRYQIYIYGKEEGAGPLTIQGERNKERNYFTTMSYRGNVSLFRFFSPLLFRPNLLDRESSLILYRLE
jgi:hypothetical protein